MAFSILDYNKALDQYNSGKVAQGYNTLISSGAPKSAINAYTTASQQKNVIPSQPTGGGGGDSRLQQLAKMDRNPAQQAEYQQLQQDQGPTGDTADPAKAMQEEIVKEFNAQNASYLKGLSDYEKASPFAFDEMLKKETQQAKTNIGPYYKQQLDNYMTGVNFLKGNTIQDEQRALTKLQGDHDAYQGNARALLDTTMRQVGQNYGNAGSYDAGARARAQGEQAANTAYETGQEQRGYEFQKTGTEIGANRILNQQIPLGVTQTTQSLNNQQAGDIYNQAQQLANYDQQKYNYLKQQAGVAAVKAEGQYSTPNTIPGLSSGQTQQYLQSILPNTQISSYGGARTAPLMGY